MRRSSSRRRHRPARWSTATAPATPLSAACSAAGSAGAAGRNACAGAPWRAPMHAPSPARARPLPTPPAWTPLADAVRARRDAPGLAARYRRRSRAAREGTRLPSPATAPPRSCPKGEHMDLRLALHELAARHRLDAAANRELHRLAGLDDPPAALQRWLPRGVAVLAAALIGLGLILWIAANWETLGRFGRFALLQGFVLVMCAGALWKPAARAPLGLLA